MGTQIDKIDVKLQDTSALESVFEQAARDAMRHHALMGSEVIVWQDGRLLAEVPKLEEYPPEDTTP